MCAVSEMLIPIQAEYYALEGLGQLINTIGLVQEHYNPNLTVSTMLVTMFDKRTLLSREVFSEVKSHYPSIVLDTTIPRTVKYLRLQVSERQSLAMTRVEWERVPMAKRPWKSPVDRLRCWLQLTRRGESNP